MPGVKRRPAPAPLFVLVLLAAGALLDCFALRVDGQDRARRAALIAAILEREQSLILARICVSEGGWGQPDACAAYHFALISKAATVRGLDWDEHAKRYTRLFDPHHPPQRIWLLGLGASAEKPNGFPPQLPWLTLHDRHGRQLGRTGYLDRWREEVRVALELVRSPRNPCQGVPIDWGSGSRVDHYKRMNPRWVEIDCPGDDTFLRPSPE